MLSPYFCRKLNIMIQERVSIHILIDGKDLVLPVSKNIRQLLEFKAIGQSKKLSEITRELVLGLCARLDIQANYSSIKVEARKRDRDVQGFIDTWVRDNVRIKISDFIQMTPEKRLEFLKFAKENIFLTSTWTINVLGHIYRGWQQDLVWPVEIKKAIHEYVCMLQQESSQPVSNG